MKRSTPKIARIAEDEFKGTVKGVLLKQLESKAKYENVRPSKEELNQKYKLVRK